MPVTTTLKIQKLGNSLGLIVPEEVSDQLHLKEGDWMHVTIEHGGAIRLTPYDPDFDKALEAFDSTRHRYRNALRELAK
jgi:putative addiction module antidote